MAEGVAPSKNVLVERALVKELKELRRQARQARWEEVAKDPVLLKDISEVEVVFQSADVETAGRLMTVFQWAVMEVNLDPVAGAEQKGTRPVLIASNEEYNQVTPNVTVLPLTSTKRRLYPSEVFLPQGRAGQPLDSTCAVSVKSD